MPAKPRRDREANSEHPEQDRAAQAMINPYKQKLGVHTRLLQRCGVFNGRNLYWRRSNPRNFGDLIGPYLYRAITGKQPLHFRPKFPPPATTYMSAGSIMDSIKRDNTAIVWGSGIIFSNDHFKKPRKILAVRGPRTRDRCIELGYACPEIYGDPGILLPYFYRPEKIPEFDLGLIPHVFDRDFIIEKYTNDDRVCIIDVTKPVEEVVDQILSCKRCVSSSLHGLIVSHAYGRPCAWVKFSDKLTGDGVKFLDYYASSESNLISRDPPPISELLDVSQSSPVPNTDALRDRLLDACPF